MPVNATQFSGRNPHQCTGFTRVYGIHPRQHPSDQGKGHEKAGMNTSSGNSNSNSSSLQLSLSLSFHSPNLFPLTTPHPSCHPIPPTPPSTLIPVPIECPLRWRGRKPPLPLPFSVDSCGFPQPPPSPSNVSGAPACPELTLASALWPPRDRGTQLQQQSLPYRESITG